MAPLFIHRVSVFSPAGATVAATAPCLLESTLQTQELDANGIDGKPYIGTVTTLPRTMRDADRLTALAHNALASCFEGAPPPTQPYPIIVCAPSRADLPQGAPEELLRRLIRAFPQHIATQGSVVLPSGREALAQSLALVQDRIGRGLWTGCYLLGVDSLVTLPRLQPLIEAGAIFCSDVPGGYVPGEGAAVILLSADKAGALAHVAGLGFAEEPAPSEDPNHAGPITGQASTVAAAQAVAAAKLHPPAFAAVVTDAGRLGGLDELELAKLRPPLAGATVEHTLTPSQTLGEMGAASGVLVLACLGFLLGTHQLRAPALALFTLNESKRASVLLTPPSPEGR